MAKLGAMEKLAGHVHSKLIFGRRVKAIANSLAPLLPGGKALDLGCGDGRIARLISECRMDVDFVGADVLIRPKTLIPAVCYDGLQLPFKDNTFSCVTVIDALHHAPDFRPLLAEALRVSDCVVIKDHFYKNGFENQLLRVMDWFGNIAHGVDLPFNYLTRIDWLECISAMNLREVYRQEEVQGLYPPGLQSVLGKNLQFVAKIERFSPGYASRDARIGI